MSELCRCISGTVHSGGQIGSQEVPGIQALHDRRVPGTRGNLDRLVIAPAGIFVGDERYYTRRIENRNRGWLLRPYPRLYVGPFATGPRPTRKARSVW